MASKGCIFCNIVSGKAKAYKVWESSTHLGFLSIFPNTKGVTVVIPKQHYPSYAFDLPNEDLSNLILAAKEVGKLLDSKLSGVGRTGLILEGFGVDHVHAKLFPMHGTGNMQRWEPIKSHKKNFFLKYEGYLSSHDAEEADPKELETLAALISGSPQTL